MIPKTFTPFARAQALGLVIGLALALWATIMAGLGIRLLLVATAAAWLIWEFALGQRAPSDATSFTALAYAFAVGFAFPWLGFALTFALDRLQP